MTNGLEYPESAADICVGGNSPVTTTTGVPICNAGPASAALIAAASDEHKTIVVRNVDGRNELLLRPNFDEARKPPDISGAQADNSFAKISKNLLTPKVCPNELYECVGTKI